MRPRRARHPAHRQHWRRHLTAYFGFEGMLWQSLLRTSVPGGGGSGGDDFPAVGEMFGDVAEFDVGSGTGSAKEDEGLLGGDLVSLHQDSFRLADQLPGCQGFAELADFWESANATAAWAATRDPVCSDSSSKASGPSP